MGAPFPATPTPMPSPSPTAEIRDAAALERRIADEPVLLAWFSGPDCNVCRALRPKVEALLAAEFPRVAMVRIDCAEARELAAQRQVFAIPTAVIWLDGREYRRFGRGFGIGELREALERPYRLLFGEG